MKGPLGQDSLSFELVAPEEKSDLQNTFSRAIFAQDGPEDELWLIRLPLEVKVEDSARWQILSNQDKNLIAKADNSGNCEDVFLEQHENDLLYFGASYPVSHPKMISRVLGVYSASNASKVCFGVEPEFQTVKESEDVDRIKPSTVVEKKHEKRKAENSEAAVLNKGHKKKKKKTREK